MLGKACPQSGVEYRDIPCVQNCMLSDWTPWTVCNSTCQGSQTRKRSVILYPSVGGTSCDPHLDETRACNADVTCPQSCNGQCGKQLSTCSCDSLCGSLGDCCQDFEATCSAISNAKPTCKFRCGVDDGAQLGCWCDSTCLGSGDCCPDFESQCPSLAQLTTSCTQRCGKKSSVLSITCLEKCDFSGHLLV